MNSDSEGSKSEKSPRESGDGMNMGNSALDTAFVCDGVFGRPHTTECECCDDTSDYPDSFSCDGGDKSNDESEDINTSMDVDYEESDALVSDEEPLSLRVLLEMLMRSLCFRRPLRG